MLSAEKAKQLIGDPSLSDDEISEILRDAYLLAEICFLTWLENPDSKIPVRLVQKFNERNKFKTWNSSMEKKG